MFTRREFLTGPFWVALGSLLTGNIVGWQTYRARASYKPSYSDSIAGSSIGS